MHFRRWHGLLDIDAAVNFAFKGAVEVQGM